MSGDAGFGLSAQAEQQDIVLAEDGALHIGQHRIIEAEDAGENGFLAAYFFDQVVAQFLFDAAGRIAGGAQGAEGLDVQEVLHGWGNKLAGERFMMDSG